MEVVRQQNNDGYLINSPTNINLNIEYLVLSSSLYFVAWFLPLTVFYDFPPERLNYYHFFIHQNDVQKVESQQGVS